MVVSACSAVRNAGTSANAIASQCASRPGWCGNPLRTERSAASVGHQPFPWAKSRTVPIRWSVRRAVSGTDSHIGASASRTLMLSIRSTGSLPIVGNIWFSRQALEESLCLALCHPCLIAA